MTALSAFGPILQTYTIQKQKNMKRGQEVICIDDTFMPPQVELIPNRGYWNNDNFYEAHGNYHLFNTCNAWTNEALQTIGVKTGWLALSSNGIMDHLK